MNTHAMIPASAARLPQTYENARIALAECSAVDECKDWADKAAALASYAKQADDDQLEKMAQRIRARAIRRAGELLKQIEPGQGARDGKRGAGDHTPFTREDAARDAGMSKHQQVQAVRVASVPADDFEKQVDGEFPPLTVGQAARIEATTDAMTRGAISRDQANERISGIDPHWSERAAHKVPTISHLASQGIQRRDPPPEPEQWLQGRDPKMFNRALHLTALIAEYAADLSKSGVSEILPHLDDGQRVKVRNALSQIDTIHDNIATRI